MTTLWPVTIAQVVSVNWILAVAMIIGLLIDIFISYRKPRKYKDIKLATQTELTAQLT
ncbi:MAG: hypothetical protein RR768_07230 [Clostridium sp.]